MVGSQIVASGGDSLRGFFLFPGPGLSLGPGSRTGVQDCGGDRGLDCSSAAHCQQLNPQNNITHFICDIGCSVTVAIDTQKKKKNLQMSRRVQADGQTHTLRLHL